MKKHKVDWGPGYKWYACEECGNSWKEITRDCTSPSGSPCDECDSHAYPTENEKHYEWPTDANGNLIVGHNYE